MRVFYLIDPRGVLLPSEFRYQGGHDCPPRELEMAFEFHASQATAG